MYQNLHPFHIPVMGTGHSIDSPIRVAHLGINSVISVVDDMLLEKIRKHYCNLFHLPFQGIHRTTEDGRAKRIKAYLECVGDIVQKKFEDLRNAPLFTDSIKDRYFQLLSEDHPLKKSYRFLSTIQVRSAREFLAEELTRKMSPGQIEVNIMAKVDALRLDKDNQPLSPEFSDASAALRGVAQSNIDLSLVLSAGFNPRLYGYLSEFKDFYRNSAGEIRKKIVLKVSDFRSALIQGKFLAKKGIEVSEFRIESGLNCGGHAFASEGILLPVLLREFREKRTQLADTFQPMIRQYYESMGWDYPEISEEEAAPAVTVQGGIGTNGEVQRLLQEYGMQSTGWGSPFLLVPEATCVDSQTQRQLESAGEEDLYLSRVSPLGVPFNNLRNSGSEQHTRALVDKGKPGSKCPKGFLVSNTEFTENPICTASNQYQLLKLDQIEQNKMDPGQKEKEKERVLEKSCLCQNLGAGALIRLGLQKPSYGRQAICPGPNLAWFDRNYQLEEMVDHIYGRGASLVPPERPHMFAKELVMYCDYLKELQEESDGQPASLKRLKRFRENLLDGMDECLRIVDSRPYGDENLDSLKQAVDQQRDQIRTLEVIPA
ncbi:MAG: hypothetical protein WD315_04065 [Balneolaceae bacterium]